MAHPTDGTQPATPARAATDDQGQGSATWEAGPPPDDGKLRPGTGMTIRCYRVTADGAREDFTATLVVPPGNVPAFGPLGYGPCSCPRCKPRRDT